MAYALWRMLGFCLLAGVLVAGLLFPVAGSIGMTSNQASDTVTRVSAELVHEQVPLVTTITDAGGVPIANVFDQNRIPVKSADIADTMKAAILAIEDRRFFEHNGVDWRGITRALATNVTSSGSALEGQGASTLTMQYVKNYLLYAVADTEAERTAAVATTPARKLREIRIALQLERQVSKEEILTRYLNIVFFGNNAYGIGSAARTYFNTTPDQLTISQAALLAGLVKSTSAFDPVDHPEAALNRRNLVIDLMVDVGSITRAQGDAAKVEPLGIQQPLSGLANGCVSAGPADGFMCQYALDYLKSVGISLEQIKRGGYTIRTTLDRRASDLVKDAVNSQVPKSTPGIANAMAVVQPGKDKHRVVALASSRDYGLDAKAGQTSFAQPSTPQPFGAGSIYKIFTAAAALEKGLGIATRVSAPSSYTSRVYTNGGAPYTVQNAGNYAAGSLTLQDALASSPNTAFVALADRIGSATPIVDMAYRLGMRTSLNVRDGEGRTIAEAVKAENRGSYTLGPEPTSPLDLANVAATLMSGGTWCPPSPIEAVTDRNGQPVPVQEQPCEQAVPEGLANTLAVGLSKDDAPGGTAYAAAQSAGWSRPMLGKTGTTQNNRSAGFVGATPQYAGAVLVWPDGSTPRPICDTDPPRLCGNGNIFGGKVPARTWFKAMIPLHESLPVLPLPPTDPRYVSGGGGTQVPNVVGQGENQARLILERAGFRVQSFQTDSTRPAGIVTSQNPSGSALPGDLVTIGVSNGNRPPVRTRESEPLPEEPDVGRTSPSPPPFEYGEPNPEFNPFVPGSDSWPGPFVPAPEPGIPEPPSE
ncbi:MAG: transglycosylase domain-containing protein [Actinomycetota bacterium]|nr:transglycosylase domain-containing protein [Actinomycetota bacterium]